MNIPYHLGLRLGQFRRSLFKLFLEQETKRQRPQGPELPFRVVSLSGERDFPEQIASWQSLLRYLGTPTEFLLASDGSHSAASLEILRRFHPRVRVVLAQDFAAPDSPPCVHRYLQQSPMGKKLAVFSAIQELTPMLYSDSDILYFPGAPHFLDLVNRGTKTLYLPDCAPSFDRELIRSEEELLNPVNAGFLYLAEAISLQKGLQRFENPSHPVSFFSEQTIVHLAVHEARGQALPKDRYIMQADDQFRFADAYAGPQLAMRHYISSIRYKMWRQVALG